MTASIAFSGWFQARFATDPDLFNHPRGQSGWTFAFAGEPNFDRVIRTIDPVAPRLHGPAVGVRVTAVTVDGAAVPAHPLVGAVLNLLDGPKFEGHNGQIANPGREPVFPFHLRIAGGPVVLEIREWITAADLIKNPPPVSAPRYGQGVGNLNAAIIERLLGTADTAAFRARRKQVLQDELANTADPTARTNLQQRLVNMDDDQMPLASLGFVVQYGFSIPAPARWAGDPGATLGNDPLGQPWRIAWWMGCWDADALSGFMDGSLTIG